MSCLTCSSFDPYYRGGYCNYHRCDTSPSGSCSSEDSRGGGFSNHTCSTCSSFDPNYHGGYCNYHRKDVYPSSSCSSYDQEQRGACNRAPYIFGLNIFVISFSLLTPNFTSSNFLIFFHFIVSKSFRIHCLNYFICKVVRVQL